MSGRAAMAGAFSFAFKTERQTAGEGRGLQTACGGKQPAHAIPHTTGAASSRSLVYQTMRRDRVQAMPYNQHKKVRWGKTRWRRACENTNTRGHDGADGRVMLRGGGKDGEVGDGMEGVGAHEWQCNQRTRTHTHTRTEKAKKIARGGRTLKPAEKVEGVCALGYGYGGSERKWVPTTTAKSARRCTQEQRRDRAGE